MILNDEHAVFHFPKFTIILSFTSLPFSFANRGVSCACFFGCLLWCCFLPADTLPVVRMYHFTGFSRILTLWSCQKVREICPFYGWSDQTDRLGLSLDCSLDMSGTSGFCLPSLPWPRLFSIEDFPYWIPSSHQYGGLSGFLSHQISIPGSKPVLLSLARALTFK